uniref:Chaperonin GroEL n=1 Tax=uncultured virus TaxID=340016 RepID=A0A240F797_9VIRU|nr:chaperonin GroEL [uncultured virus]
MEYNQPSEIVKDVTFGDNANSKIVAGVEKLAKAVKSTLGASGKCVIYEDARGLPVITKDGVTVAESVVLFDPVENMGATLIKEAARNTVREAGDGTTTATVLAESLLKEVNSSDATNIREIKDGIKSGLKKVNDYLDKVSVKIEGDMLESVSSISCNNDAELGKIIAEAYTKVGKDGVVLMEESPTEETYVEVVDGVQIDSGLTSPHFVTDKDKQVCELDNPLVLIVSSEIPNIRKIQTVLEHVIKTKRPLLIVAPVDQQVKAALCMNKVKGNIKVNIVDLPGFGPTKEDTVADLAFLVGAKVINEQLGDDLDLIDVDCLGEAYTAITDDKNTVLTIDTPEDEMEERIASINKTIDKWEKNPFIQKKHRQRLAMLSGSVGMVKVGADSKVELKEKKDRIEDAIYATKAALKEGIVPGGGVALLNASQKIPAKTPGEKILLKAIQAPFYTVLDNAGITMMDGYEDHEGYGIDVVTGERATMISAGIIDPVLVTKSALKNAVSVVSTIISADCVISNMRMNESNQ